MNKLEEYLGKIQHFFTEGSVWKDGNKLGKKRTKEMQKDYSEMIVQRLKDITEEYREYLVDLSGNNIKVGGIDYV